MGGIGPVATIPLISFHSLIDEDFACIKYAILSIGSNPSFNLDKIKEKTYFDILNDIYSRKYLNPLYYLKSDSANEELLDRVYSEMLTDLEYEVLQYSIKTEVFSLAKDFKKSSDVIPNILYYTDSQRKILEEQKELNGIDLISIKEAIKYPNQWTQYFFRYIDEMKPFKDLSDKTFYFSSSGLNLNEDDSDILLDRDALLPLVHNNVKISMFDMYRLELIRSK